MSRRVEMGDAFIHPINRNRVLNQIIRPDAEKIDFPREHVRGNRRARNFDHGAGFHFFSDVDFGSAQFFLALIQDRHRLAQFFQPGNHWEHNFDVANSAGAENGAQLRFEDIDVLETKTDGAPAKKRIQLVANIDRPGCQLITAEVECANDQRMRQDLLCHFAICFVLLLLAW